MTQDTIINPALTGKITPQLPSGQTINRPAEESEVSFSRHLLDRINRRNLQVGPEETRKLSEAIDKAEAKGSKDSLVLLNDLAFIVSVQNRKVVTAMNKNNMNEGVFTNIDSAIIMND